MVLGLRVAVRMAVCGNRKSQTSSQKEARVGFGNVLLAAEGGISIMYNTSQLFIWVVCIGT